MSHEARLTQLLDRYLVKYAPASSSATAPVNSTAATTNLNVPQWQHSSNTHTAQPAATVAAPASFAASLPPLPSALSTPEKRPNARSLAATAIGANSLSSSFALPMSNSLTNSWPSAGGGGSGSASGTAAPSLSSSFNSASLLATQPQPQSATAAPAVAPATSSPSRVADLQQLQQQIDALSRKLQAPTLTAGVNAWPSAAGNGHIATATAPLPLSLPLHAPVSLNDLDSSLALYGRGTTSSYGGADNDEATNVSSPHRPSSSSVTAASAHSSPHTYRTHSATHVSPSSSSSALRSQLSAAQKAIHRSQSALSEKATALSTLAREHDSVLARITAAKAAVEERDALAAELAQTKKSLLHSEKIRKEQLEYIKLLHTQIAALQHANTSILQSTPTAAAVSHAVSGRSEHSNGTHTHATTSVRRRPVTATPRRDSVARSTSVSRPTSAAAMRTGMTPQHTRAIKSVSHKKPLSPVNVTSSNSSSSKKPATAVSHKKIVTQSLPTTARKANPPMRIG